MTSSYTITIHVNEKRSGRSRAAVKQAVGQFLANVGDDGLAAEGLDMAHYLVAEVVA